MHVFFVVIIIDACSSDYDASLNQRNGTIIPNEIISLKIMQICCKIVSTNLHNIANTKWKQKMFQPYFCNSSLTFG